MNLDRRGFLKGAGAAAVAAGAGLTAEAAKADMRIEELPSGDTVPEATLTEDQKRMAEQAFERAEKMGADYFDYEDAEANEMTLDEAVTPELLTAYAAIVSGILSGLRRHQQAESAPKEKYPGITMWKPIRVADRDVRTMGVAHIDRTLRKSFPKILEELKRRDVVILESIQGGKILQKTRDALVADPSILEYPETFAEWRKRTGSKGFFDTIAACALALNKRVFVTDPGGDAIGNVMFMIDLAAALASMNLVARDYRLFRSTAATPAVVTMLSHLKQIGEIGADVSGKLSSISLREYTPQKFARLLWDVNDWRDIHAALDTRQLAEAGVIPTGEEALLIRGSAHGPSVTRYLSEPREAQLKRLAYPHWETVRAVSDVFTKLKKKDPNTYSFELMPDLSRRALPK